MSCRRTQEIDLMTFLSDGSGEEFAAFREHYPSCDECAAEVRAWTELHLLLAGGRSGTEAAHPAEEQLLRFEERPETLPAEERRAIEAHLEFCRSCPDELRALRGFDFASLGASPAAKTPAWRRWLETFPEQARNLLWHPAFAYALVLILLYPIVTREWRDSTQAPRAPDIPVLEEGSFVEPEARKRSALSDAVERDYATPEARFEYRTAPASEPSPPPRAAMEREPAALERERLGALAQERSGLGKPSRGFSTEEAAEANRAPKESLPRAGRVAPAALRMAKQKRADAVAAQPGLASFGAVETTALTLEQDGLAELYGSDVREGLRLRLPVSSLAREGTRIEVRVLGPEGRRELRERFQLRANQTYVELDLPAGWVSAGLHSVELRLFETEQLEPSFESAFRVR
jgi:hypothetical protein